MTAKVNSTSTNEVISNVVEITGPTMAVSQAAARISFAASAMTLVFLGALHVLSPEFDPSWRMVSEYALGNYGWVLSLMFISWAISSWALYFALRPHVKTKAGKVGLIILLIVGLGQLMASIFSVRDE